jgi:ribosome modulation factor
MARKRQREGQGEPQLVQETRSRGAQARLDGKSRDSCPIESDDYPIRGLRSAWFEGWDGAVQARVPEVRVQEPFVQSPPGTFLPADAPMPDTYRRRGPIPCERCRALLLPGLTQAVVVSSISDDFAYLWCRGCGLRFKRRLVD